MKVVKVINNNVVSCLDAAGREVIAMGKGLGFQARSGDNISAAQIEKVFRMDTQKEFDSFKNLLEAIPAEQIELCNQIISYAAEILDRKLRENLYLTLTDHISFAIEQCENGRFFHNALLTEVRIFYPKEFAVGKYALALLKSRLGLNFPEDEAASIALHLVNAEYDGSINTTMHITQTLHDILKMLSSAKTLRLDIHSPYYDEFTIVLKFMVFRAFGGQAADSSKAENAFVGSVKRIYLREYEACTKVAQLLEQQTGTRIAEQDVANLAVQLHRASAVSDKV